MVSVDDQPTETDWDRCVEYLLGPRMINETPAQRQRLALELAAAALRAAGEHPMAENLLN